MTRSLRVGLETPTSNDRERPWVDQETHWAALMIKAQAGDGDAYQTLLKEVGEGVAAYLRSRFGSADFVEDCVQEVLISLHRARGSYDPNRAFRPWLFTIVRNKAIDFLRRQSTRIRRESPEEDTERVASPAPTPAATVEASRDGGVLLDRLEQPYRNAVMLTKLKGLSLADAARLEGVTATAMKSRVHRGLRALRKGLRQEDPP